MGWKWPTPCLGPWMSSLRSHLVLMGSSWEAPSLCSCPKVEGRSGSSVGLPTHSEMPGRPNSITHQVLCIGHARNASIPWGDRSAVNQITTRLQVKYTGLCRQPGWVSARGVGQVYKPGRTLFSQGGWCIGRSPSTWALGSQGTPTSQRLHVPGTCHGVPLL